MKGSRPDRFRVTLSCGCSVYTTMRPARNESRYACRSNQGHSYDQVWTSFWNPHFGRTFENPLLTRVT